MARVGIERRPLGIADIALAVWIAILAAVTIYGAFTTTGFLTVSNGKAILTAASFVGIIAVGLTVIILSGNLFSLALGQTAAISAMVFLYSLRFGLAAAIIVTLLLGLAIGSVQGFAVGAWGANPIIITIGAAGPDGGHGRLALARPEHHPALRRDELGAPRATRARPPRPRLRLHRGHDHPRGGDAPHAIRASDLPARREPRRRPGSGPADHAPHRRRVRDRLALHGRLRDPDRRNERECLPAPHRELHLRRDRGRPRRGQRGDGRARVDREDSRWVRSSSRRSRTCSSCGATRRAARSSFAGSSSSWSWC